VTGTVLANDAILSGNRIASTQSIRWTIWQQRLRSVGSGGDRTADPRSSATAASPGETWLDRAWRALAAGDYQSAAYAAGMARRYGETMQTPLVLACADAGMASFEKAVLEAQRAVQLDPYDAERRLTLGGIFEELGNWNAAERCYLAAARLAPRSDAPHVGRASILMRVGDVAGAVRILETIQARGSAEPLVGEYLSLALVQAAEQVPRIRDSDTYVITAPAEITQMRARLARAAAVTRRPDTRASIAAIRAYVDRCARCEWAVGQALRRLVRRGSAGSLGTAAVAALILAAAAARAVSPVVAVMVILSAAAGILIGYGCVPRWKLNRWASDDERTDPRARPHRP
jgi:Flp pilus assembly protein TadD